MGALNAVCVDNRYRVRFGSNYGVSRPEFPAFRAKQYDTLEREEIEIEWTNLNETELQAIAAEELAAKRSGKTSWTPPGEGADRAFRVVEYTDGAESAQTFFASMTLRFLPGVAA